MSEELTSSQSNRFQFLLIKAVDNEMTRSEQCEFQRFLNTFDSCKLEWQQFKRLQKVTKDMKLKSPPEEVWDKFWANVRHRLERDRAWILFQSAVLAFEKIHLINN